MELLVEGGRLVPRMRDGVYALNNSPGHTAGAAVVCGHSR